MNAVGVDVNTASPPLLSHVAGDELVVDDGARDPLFFFEQEVPERLEQREVAAYLDGQELVSQ